MEITFKYLEDIGFSKQTHTYVCATETTFEKDGFKVEHKMVSDSGIFTNS